MPRADLAASVTAAVASGIVQKTEQALLQTGYKALVMAGGVAANSHLREALSALAARHGAQFTVPTRALCGDNGAMVAAAGYFELLRGNLADVALNASASDAI